MKNRNLILMTVVFFTAVLVFVGSRGYLDSGLNLFKDATAPVEVFFSGVSGNTSSFFSGIFQLGKLQQQNAKLSDTVNQLQAQVAQLSEDKKENNRLKALLGFTTAHNFNYVSASVIGYDPSNIRGNLTIDKGTNDKLANGMAVISDGFLIGRIDSCGPKTCRIKLVTDPESAIPVVLQNSNTSGIANGEIGYGLSMQKIPQGETINKGDVVISSGLGGDIPKGLIIGTVERVQKQENALFVSADIRPSADLSSLSRIIVITNS